MQTGGHSAAYVTVLWLLLLCAMATLLWLSATLKKSRQRAHQLQRQFEEMESAYISAPLGLAMFDADLRYTRVNQRLADFNGRSMADHVGKSIPEVVPDVAPQAEQSFRHVLETGDPLLGIVFEGATIAEPEVLRAWRESVYPIFSEKGEVIGLNVAVEEVTQERRLSAALRDSEQRERVRASELEAIMNATPAGIVIARDPQCLHVAGNPEAYRMLRVDPGSNVSADTSNNSKLGVFAESETGVPVPSHQLPMQVAAATGAAVLGVQLKYRLEDGETIHTLVNAAPLRNEQGEVSGAVGAFIDVTAQKQAEQALQQDSRRKDEFLATLAHELRNPLAAIQSGLEMMRLAPASLPSTQQTHAIMERQLAHLTRLIDDLLDVSRISSGKFEIRKEAVDLRAVLEDALDVSKPYVESCGHTLQVHLPAAPVYVDGDAVRLSQVVNNLLNNAAKYTPEGGHITLGLEQQAGDVLIRVTDNGIGIEDDLLPELFNMYTQLEKGKDLRKGGIGIGLSLAKRIVELHGGIMGVQSAGPGKGSSFSVRLAAIAAPASSFSPDLPAPSTTGASQRIMVVDDNEDAAQTLSALLGMGGHPIALAYTGREAIALAKSFQPEVSFVDIGLPDISGLEVARALRAEPALQNTRLVALTGWGSEKDRLASLASGFDFHITKPATLEAIKAILPDLKMPSPR